MGEYGFRYSIGCCWGKTVTYNIKTTGQEKCRITVGLAAKGNGTELKLFIVFKGGKRDVAKFKKEYGNKCIIAFSTSGWMDTDLTLGCTNTVIGQFSFKRPLVA